MPCFDPVCRFGHTRCLVGVAPERVEAALLDAAARQIENLPA
jgi:heptosyltransferase-2